jgi:glycosyltransferase involved in cell wall biosynthesis
LPVDEFKEWMTHNVGGHFVFVNDGSTDSTLDVLQQFKAQFPDRIEVVDLTKNVGKAMAVHAGFNWVFDQEKFSDATTIGYMDADLAAPIRELKRLSEILERENMQLVFGSRILKIGSNIERKGYRHYLGRIIATLISLSLRLPIYDTQCGAKVFRKNDVTKNLFKKPFISRWLFDVEIFGRVKQQCDFYNDVKEEPLTEWIEKGGSKITFGDTLKIPLELIKINRSESLRS